MTITMPAEELEISLGISVASSDFFTRFHLKYIKAAERLSVGEMRNKYNSSNSVHFQSLTTSPSFWALPAPCRGHHASLHGLPCCDIPLS